jgi:TRAP-type C4-dicarboxylate transport system permease small subunit
MKRLLSRIFDIGMEFLSSTALFVMFCIVMYGIYARYFVTRPGYWIEELARYCMFAMTMIGAAAAVAKDIHPALTFTTSGLKGAKKFIVDMWVEILLLTTLAILLYAGWITVMESRRIRTVGLRIYYSRIYFFIPLGCAFMGVATLRRLAKLWRERRNAGAPPPAKIEGES